MAKKAVRKKTIHLGNKSISIDVNMFPRTGHTDYSGFGAHEDKNRRNTRRENKLHAKRINMENYDQF